MATNLDAAIEQYYHIRAVSRPAQASYSEEGTGTFDAKPCSRCLLSPLLERDVTPATLSSNYIYITVAIREHSCLFSVNL